MNICTYVLSLQIWLSFLTLCFRNNFILQSFVWDDSLSMKQRLLWAVIKSVASIIRLIISHSKSDYKPVVSGYLKKYCLVFINSYWYIYYMTYNCWEVSLYYSLCEYCLVLYCELCDIVVYTLGNMHCISLAVLNCLSWFTFHAVGTNCPLCWRAYYTPNQSLIHYDTEVKFNSSS